MVQVWSSSIDWCIDMPCKAFSHLAEHARMFIVEHSSLDLILFPIGIVSYNMDKYQHISLSMHVLVSSDPERSPSDDTSYDGIHRFIHVRTVEWLSIDEVTPRMCSQSIDRVYVWVYKILTQYSSRIDENDQPISFYFAWDGISQNRYVSLSLYRACSHYRLLYMRRVSCVCTRILTYDEIDIVTNITAIVTV
jgi:hypothetical protein